jgi:hypothetical protein
MFYMMMENFKKSKKRMKIEKKVQYKSFIEKKRFMDKHISILYGKMRSFLKAHLT